MNSDDEMRLLQRIEAAYRRGFSAYLAERPETDNPHAKGSEEASSWLAGHMSAQRRAGRRSIVTAAETLEFHVGTMEMVSDAQVDLIHLTKGEMRALAEAARFVAALPWWARLLRRASA